MAISQREKEILKGLKKETPLQRRLSKFIYKGEELYHNLPAKIVRIGMKNEEQAVAESIYRGMLKAKMNKVKDKRQYFPVLTKERAGYTFGENPWLSRYIFGTDSPTIKDIEMSIKYPKLTIDRIKSRNMVGAIGIGTLLGGLVGKQMSHQDKQRGLVLGSLAGGASGGALAYLLNKNTEKIFRKTLKGIL